MKYREAVDFFTKKHLWFSNNVAGRNTSQNEFAAWLDVPAGTLSLLMGGARHPNDINMHKLAAKLGPEIYDVYGTPRLMPDDPVLNVVMKKWFDWPEDMRQRWADLAEQVEQDERVKKINTLVPVIGGS